MLPKIPVALQNFAWTLRKIPFVHKRASGAFPDAPACPLYEQGRKANEFLCGNRDISHLRPLDRVSVRAQNRSYTNKMTMPRNPAV
jgi:hypothetical protein